MVEVYELRQSRPELSLRRFAHYARVPYWQLRDFEKSVATRNKRDQERDALRKQVKQVALLHPTYGYRFLYQELRDQGEQVGLHRVRELLGELGLNPPHPRETRKPSVAVTALPDWPVGRRIQIDATRLSLADGVCWVYHVLDVQSRVVLASKAVRSLSMQLAKAVLDEGVAVLRSQGVHAPYLSRVTAARISPVRCSSKLVSSTVPGSDVRLVRKAVWGCSKD